MIPDTAVVIDYTNYKGTRKTIKIIPMSMVFEANEYYPVTQWLVNAMDMERNVLRTYAMVNIHSWKVLTDEQH